MILHRSASSASGSRLRFWAILALVVAANLANVASAQTDVAQVPGILPEPLEVSPGIWFLGTGPDGHMKESLNINAADTVNANQLWPGGGLGLNLNGAGTTVGIWDGGQVRSTHQEFGGRVTVLDVDLPLNFHATHVAGTIGAAGVNASAHGMANGVLLRSRNFNNDLAELAADASNGLINLSNHSYGYRRGWESLVWDRTTAENSWIADRSRYTVDPNFGKYDFDASSIDSILNQNQNVLAVWSAGNDRGQSFTNLQGDNTYVAWFSNNDFVGWVGAGFYRVSNGQIPAPGADGAFDSLPNGGQTSKNALVIGAINDITADPYNNGNVNIAAFSSWGPTDDGRLGVDLVANGVGLFSTLETSNTVYGSLNGTSMAAPTTTGTLALLREHTINEKGAPPTAASLKGLAIHTAFDAGNVGPDYTFGWGVLDAAAAATFVTDTEAAVPEDFMLENTYAGTPWSMKVMADGSSPLKATLAWQDLAGAALDSNLSTAVLNLTIPTLVNDLDLWIEDSIGNIFYPWNLNPGLPNNPAFRSALNHRENTEQVLIDMPTAGLYTIYVGHTGANFLQNYSLLFSGAAAVPEPATLLLLLAGSMGALGSRCRRRNS